LAFFYVHQTATFSLSGLKARFSGPESPEIATFTALELLQTTHTHLFTMAFLQFMAGGLFLLSSAPPRMKAWLGGGGFGLVALDHGAMWVVRSFPALTPGILVSGGLLGLCLLLELCWCLWDLSLGHSSPQKS
jgi:hypothetical protein